jgi:hypothetical protein
MTRDSTDVLCPAIRRQPPEGIYRRVSVRMYGDAKYMRLSPLLASGQALWVYLLTGPHTGPIPGVFVAGRAAIAESLGWKSEAFEKALAEVLAEGLVEFDAKTRLWLIPKAIHHNTPPNPNVVKSWRNHWIQLPECDLRDRIGKHLHESLTEVSESFAKAFKEACGKPFEKASPNHMAKQEAGGRKQEQEQNQLTPTASSSVAPTPKAPPIPSCPYDKILAIYNEVLSALPAAKTKAESRKKTMDKRWKWIFTDLKTDGTHRATTESDALAWMRSYFERAQKNDFLMGRTSRSAEHTNWRCDLDFLLSDKGLVHVIEKTVESTA